MVNVKFTIPSRYDREPFGTIIKCRLDNNIEIYYIQVSKDDMQPEWILLADFFEACFIEFIDNKEMMDLALQLYLVRDIKIPKDIPKVITYD